MKAIIVELPHRPGAFYSKIPNTEEKAETTSSNQSSDQLVFKFWTYWDIRVVHDVTTSEALVFHRDLSELEDLRELRYYSPLVS